MENHFSRTMSAKSDDELSIIIISENEYSADAIAAAKWEVESRAFAKSAAEEERTDESGFSVENEVKMSSEERKPRVYSETVLIVFGILFSVFASGILVAMNLLEVKKRMQALFAILFSLAFVIIQAVLLQLMKLPISSLVSIPFSIVGVMLMQKLIWEKECPPGVSYRKRAPWIPLAVGLALSLAGAAFLYYSYGTLPGMPAVK